MPKDTTSRDSLRVTLGQHSSPGRKPENQDFHGATVPEGHVLALKGIALAIADGISTSAFGREAAETSVASLMTDYYATPDAWTVKTSASRVISATNSWLHARNTSLGDINAGHVCAFSALILKGREGYMFHVGDGRVQRVSGQSLEPFTTDHRVVLSATREYLGRALGAEGSVEIDYRKVALAEGDIFVLSTDGVHEHLSPRAIATLATDHAPEEAAERIVAAALDAGSPDNLTVQVVRIDTLPAPGIELDIGQAGLPVPPLPESGDTLDGFRVVRPLHASARSHVFLATDPQGRRVTLKIPAGETAQDPEFLRRFVLEEWIARRVSSPHVLQAAEPPAERSALYVATDYAEGSTLRQWMTDNPRAPLDKVRDIVAQIASGLRALHRRQMIHQDLRPENVMIDATGTVKIIDLGSASVAGVEEAAPGMLGAMPGTYQYTAPEYLSGDVVSWRSDQYALGVIAYEMLTGRLPYGAQVARIRSRTDQRRLKYLPARDDETGVPLWVDAALRKATNPDPLRRYDALTEFLADLRRPADGWAAGRHIPLAERNPVRFWQSVSGVLALLCLILAVR